MAKKAQKGGRQKATKQQMRGDGRSGKPLAASPKSARVMGQAVKIYGGALRRLADR